MNRTERKKMAQRVDKRLNTQLMERVARQVMQKCGEKVGRTVMKEVRKDAVLPCINLLKGTKVSCQLFTDEAGDYIELVIGPRDFIFNAGTGVKESSSMATRVAGV